MSFSADIFIQGDGPYVCDRFVLPCVETFFDYYLVIYASKRRLGTMTLHVLEAVSSAEQSLQPRRTNVLAPRSFRTYGEVSPA